jgi:GR25 family glycosyltransferase involved in LPS biosynthesis
MIWVGHLQAGIENYLKKIPSAKEEAHLHSMQNIDFIYLINLDERPEKWESCVQELRPWSICPYRFSAVNGWELPLEATDALGIKCTSKKSIRNRLWGTCYLPDRDFAPHNELIHVFGRTYFSHCMSRGAIGIVLSHLSVLQDAYDAGYQTIWVMEDDIEVIENPHLLSDLIPHLDRLTGDEGWDILFTDPDTKNREGEYVRCTGVARRLNFPAPNAEKLAITKAISPEFRRIGLRYGSYSMILRRGGIRKILDFFQNYQIFLPYDLEYVLIPGILLYTVTRDVVSTQPKAASDNGFPNYKTRENHQAE